MTPNSARGEVTVLIFDRNLLLCPSYSALARIESAADRGLSVVCKDLLVDSTVTLRLVSSVLFNAADGVLGQRVTYEELVLLIIRQGIIKSATQALQFLYSAAAISTRLLQGGEQRGRAKTEGHGWAPALVRLFRVCTRSVALVARSILGSYSGRVLGSA